MSDPDDEDDGTMGDWQGHPRKLSRHPPYQCESTLEASSLARGALVGEQHDAASRIDAIERYPGVGSSRVSKILKSQGRAEQSKEVLASELLPKQPRAADMDGGRDVTEGLEVTSKELDDCIDAAVMRMRGDVKVGPDGLGRRQMLNILDKAPEALAAFVG